MKKGRNFLKVPSVIGAIILVAAVAAAIWASRLPKVGVLFPDTNGLSTVTITQPFDGGNVFLNDNVTVGVNAATLKPVDHFELWVDGVQTDTLSGEATILDRYMYDVAFRWTPDTLGEHTLVVRAVGADFTDNSNAVRLTVLSLTTPASGSPYMPTPGDTLDSVADKFGLPPLLLLAANPQVPSLTDPLPPDNPVIIPDLPPNSNGEPPAGVPQIPPNLYPYGLGPRPAPYAPGGFSIWFDTNFGSGRRPAAIPVAPELVGWQEDCGARLMVVNHADNALGFFLYRLDPTSSSFARIATFGSVGPGETFEYLDTGLYGSYQYYATAFNAAGEASSGAIRVDITDIACLPPEQMVWRLTRVTLTSDLPVDKAYCYYSFVPGLWERIPVDPQSFVYPTGNGFDFSRQFNGLVLPQQGTLSLECWGWSGGALLPLGSAVSDIVQGGVNPNATLHLRGDNFSATGDARAILGKPPTMHTMGGTPLPTPTKVPGGKTPTPTKTPGLPPMVSVTLVSPSFPDLPLAPYIHPPKSLAQTNFLDVCINHFPEDTRGFFAPLFCAPAVKNHDTILVWEWSQGDGLPIDGFNVYRWLPGGTPVLFKTIANPDQKIFFQTYVAPDKDVPAARYCVRAYSGADQSVCSNVWVMSMPAAVGMETVFITNPTLISWDYGNRDFRDTPCSYKNYPYEGMDPSTQIAVGFYYEWFADGCYRDAERWNQGTVVFNDLSGIKGPIVSAELQFQQKETAVTAPSGAEAAVTSCAARLDIVTATGKWGEATASSPYLALSPYGGMDYVHRVDVTSAVMDWVSGKTPNQGFVFIGRKEGIIVPIPKAYTCWSRYWIMGLLVKYYLPSP
jgi:hypothetical protein